MKNVEELHLQFLNKSKSLIDGNVLQKYFINHMSKLNKLTFNIGSLVRFDDENNIPSNEDIKKHSKILIIKLFQILIILNKKIKFIVIFIHIHIHGIFIIILQIIFLVVYLNLFVKYHYLMNTHLNMIFFFELLNHFHLLIK